MTVTFVLCLEFSQLIILSKEVCIYLVSLPGDILSCCLLVSQFYKHAILFSLKSIKLCPKLLIKLALISEILLKISVYHILN